MTGKRFVRVVRLWIRHIHVNRRFSLVCRGYEGSLIYSLFRDFLVCKLLTQPGLWF